MMTDKDRFIELFNSVQIEYTDNPKYNILLDDDSYIKGSVLTCSEGSMGVQGYSGFYTDFYFDEDGHFLYMGIWE